MLQVAFFCLSRFFTHDAAECPRHEQYVTLSVFKVCRHAPVRHPVCFLPFTPQPTCPPARLWSFHCPPPSRPHTTMPFHLLLLEACFLMPFCSRLPFHACPFSFFCLSPYKTLHTEPALTYVTFQFDARREEWGGSRLHMPHNEEFIRRPIPPVFREIFMSAH